MSEQSQNETNFKQEILYKNPKFVFRLHYHKNYWLPRIENPFWKLSKNAQKIMKNWKKCDKKPTKQPKN